MSDSPAPHLEQPDRDAPGRVWTAPRAITAHIALAIWLPGCAVATWWQLSIALSGDSIGWVYSIMWPCFAVFGTVFWWNIVHLDPQTVGSQGLRHLERDRDDYDDQRRAAAEELITQAEKEDPELASYNEYLASLAQSDRRKSWLRD